MNKPLQLVTYNIHGGVGRDGIHDYKRINRLLREHNVDIALLQEVETRPPERDCAQDIEDLCGDYFHHYVAAPAMHGLDGWYGNAVLSRYPIVDREIVDITVPGREPRNLIDAYIETPQGLLRVMNTHKGLKRTERHRQLERIHRELDENPHIPLVFGGDINEWQPVFSITRMLNETLKAKPVGPTCPSYFPFLHLDRFWCRPSGLIIQAEVLRTAETKFYSDHLPVQAVLKPV